MPKHPMRLTLSTACLLLVTLLIGGCASTSEVPWKEGDAYVLQLRPTAGQVFDGVVTNENASDISVMGQQIDQNQEMTWHYTYTVEEVGPEGVAAMQVTTDRLQTTMQGMGQNMTFDSDDVGERIPPIHRPYMAMVGESVQLTVAADGSIRETQGIAELSQRILDSVDFPNPQQTEAMRSQMETMMGEEPLLDNYRTTFRMYPESPVAIGESWTDSYTTYAGLPMTADVTYTLDRVEDGIAHLSFEGTINTEDSEMDMGMFSMTMSINGTQEGQLTMDLRTGMVQTMEQTLTTSSTGAMENPADPNQEIQMEMDGTNRTSVTLTLQD